MEVGGGGRWKWLLQVGPSRMKRELQRVESCKINSHAPVSSLFSVKPVLSYKNLHGRRSFSWEAAAQVTAGHLQHPAFMRTLPCLHTCTQVQGFSGLPGCSAVKNPSASAGDTGDLGLIPGSGRSSGGGNANPLQYSCLGNPMDRVALRATVHGVAESGHD